MFFIKTYDFVFLGFEHNNSSSLALLGPSLTTREGRAKTRRKKKQKIVYQKNLKSDDDGDERVERGASCDDAPLSYMKYLEESFDQSFDSKLPTPFALLLRFDICS